MLLEGKEKKDMADILDQTPFQTTELQLWSSKT